MNEFFNNVDPWLAQHPWWRAALIALTLSLITAMINLFARTETPAEWEKMKAKHPRAAAAIALARALGLDPVKALNALRTLLTGRWGVPPSLPPSGADSPEEKRPGFGDLKRVALTVKLGVAGALLLALGCAPTSAQIRSGLLLTGRGVVEANRLCGFAAQELGRSKPTEAVALARTCTKVSDTTFHALQAGELALDSANATSALCAISSGLEGLRSIVNAAKSAFGDVVPKAIEDALTTGTALASLVAGKCEATP